MIGFLANPGSLTILKCSSRCLTLLIMMSQMRIYVGRECISELLSASLSSRIVGFSVISLAPHRAPNNRDQDTKLTSLHFTSLLFSSLLPLSRWCQFWRSGRGTSGWWNPSSLPKFPSPVGPDFGRPHRSWDCGEWKPYEYQSSLVKCINSSFMFLQAWVVCLSSQHTTLHLQCDSRRAIYVFIFIFLLNSGVRNQE